jgi:hypothetical protein
MKYTVIKPFSWAHRGVEIKEYTKDQIIDSEDQDDDLIDVGMKEGWIGKSNENNKTVISDKSHKSPGAKETILEKAKNIFK